MRRSSVPPLTMALLQWLNTHHWGNIARTFGKTQSYQRMHFDGPNSIELRFKREPS